MIGSWTVLVKEVRPFTIHGDQYYELHGVRANDPDAQPIVIRLPQHAAQVVPQPEQTLLIKFLMGQVTEVRPVG